MKITPWYLAALAPFAAIGCSGAYLGHALVMALTLGIFSPRTAQIWCRL